MRPKIPDLIEALESRWVAYHSTVARQILAHIDFLDDTIQTLTAEIVECVVPFEAAAELLKTIPGVSELTAQTIIAEIGVHMSRFPTAGHLAAWAGVAPASHRSEEHTSELQSLMRNSYAVFCSKTKTTLLLLQNHSYYNHHTIKL